MKVFFSGLTLFLTVLQGTSHAKTQRLPDKDYFIERKAIDSLEATDAIRHYVANHIQLNNATDRLVALGAKYRLTVSDASDLINLSLIVQHPKGLQLGVQAMVMVSAEPVARIIQRQKNFIKEVYKIDVDHDLAQTPAMARTIANLKSSNDALLRSAKLNLDLGAIELITTLYTRDDQVRNIENYVFKDSSAFDFRSPQYPTSNRYPMGRWMAYEMADSVNLSELYKYLLTNPFPGESIAGQWSSRIWIVLRHCSELLLCQNKANLEKYLMQWESILAIAYDNSLNGEFSADKYAYVHYSVIEAAKNNVGTDAMAFFMKYAPKEPFMVRR